MPAIAVKGVYTPGFNFGGSANLLVHTSLGGYNQVVGNLIVVAVSCYDTPFDGGGAPTISDLAGNTWTAGTRYSVGVNRTVQFFWAENCLGNAGNRIDATFGAGTTYFGTICAWDISNAALTSSHCGEAMGWQPATVTSPIATGAGAGSSNLTTTKANALILAFGVQGDFSTAGTRTAQTSPAYTQDGVDWGSGNDDLIYEHRGVTAIQTGAVVNYNTTDTASGGVIVAEAFADATQPALTHSISGSAGVAGATVSWTGTASGSTTADGSGNYTIPSLADGSYTITPTKTGYSFSPTNSAQTVSGADITGVNFTATQILVATPTFSPVAGAYGPAQTVTISSTDSGLSGFAITYTTDGTTPVPGSHGTTYTVPITVSTTQTVKAVASATGYANSATGSAAYTINGALNTPTFSPVAGTYTGAQTVTISSNGIGEAIYWNTTGSPTSGSTLYVSPITVAATETVYAIAEKSGWSNSAVGSATYTINNPPPSGDNSPVVDSGASDTTRINSPNTSVFGTGGRTRIIG